MARKKKFDCWKCEYRGAVPGSAHICCKHPSLKELHDNATLQMLAIFGSVGRVPPFALSSKELNIKGDSYGMQMGWFNFPLNFDPTWLVSCNGFEDRS